MTSTTNHNPQLAAEGMSLLPRKVRSQHPRAQVQSLRRIATRAVGQADRIRQYTPQDTAGAAELDRKALVATEAMKMLNAVHGLGY
jgi:hypothetical protein